MKCKPDYVYLDDGHVMCKAKCPRIIRQLFVSARTGKQINFTGCPELLSCFYQREIWTRNLGIQKVGEQTRNLILINTSKAAFQHAKERISAGHKALLEMGKPKKDDEEKEDDNG